MANNNTTTNDSLTTFIAHLPKAELHVHLEGCLTPQLAQTLAQRNNVPLPNSVKQASTTSSSGFAFHDLSSFLAVYYSAMTVLQTAADFHDLAMDYLTKAHEQNVLHCELFFDPQAHTSRGVPFPTVVSGYRSAVLQAQRELGVSTSLIMCFLRDMSAEFAMATLMDALPFKDCIIGVGLDSDERGNPPRKFAEVFERARKEGFMRTMHCDVDQVGSIEHIRQALEEIGVDRLDHGTNIVEDARLVEMVREKRIGLTCCPISNSVVCSDFKGKEIMQLFRQGARVTINSDDPAYFRGYANENVLRLAREEELKVTRKELVGLMKNAFEISWISSWSRDAFLKVLDEYAERHRIS
ncbi:adenine deaminase [Lithohypha guttulata]|uniref:Adenine deaminase n=1 Tax=Lithohypha guttulata TaxID=1690604 RepID=A0AAN7T856_9EURO|nr:adenine deaminase [Lithohypha guttulata]